MSTTALTAGWAVVLSITFLSFCIVLGRLSGVIRAEKNSGFFSRCLAMYKKPMNQCIVTGFLTCSMLLGFCIAKLAAPRGAIIGVDAGITTIVMLGGSAFWIFRIQFYLAFTEVTLKVGLHALTVHHQPSAEY